MEGERPREPLGLKARWQMEGERPREPLGLKALVDRSADILVRIRIADKRLKALRILA